MKKRLIVNAINVHQGGGKSLLLALLSAIPDDVDLMLLVDKRIALDNNASKEIHIKYIKPSIISRIASERWLSKNVKPDDYVLCLGNLPPLFKVKGRVVLFIQNLHMGKRIKINGFGFYMKLRILIERFWLYNQIKNTDEILVQTPTMERVLELNQYDNIKVTVKPFLESAEDVFCEGTNSFENDDCSNRIFLYVASGGVHKNHRALIEAWCLLADEGIYPMLKLTLDAVEFSALCEWINQKKIDYGLRLENKGFLEKEKISMLYKSVDALVYPSNHESFGLPLYEAMQVGLPILASELDYVRDAVDPGEVFDPASAMSIARAVKRFLKIKEKRQPLCSAKSFIRHVVNHEVE